MKLNTIQIVFLSNLYYSKLSGVGKINPTIIKPKIPTNIPGLNNLGQVIASNGGTQVVANSAESNSGIEGMPNSVISGGSVIGFGLGKTKTTTRGRNSVEVIGKKDLEEKLEKENKTESPIEIENPLAGSALNVTKDADSSNLQSADSGKTSSSKSGVTGILGGVESAIYNVGSTAVGLASSVVDTAVSKVVAPIVSPVVNLVVASGNDQSKIENIKSGSAKDGAKDDGSPSLQSGDSGETSSSKLGVTGILGGVGSAVYNVGSTAVGLASSVVDTAVSKVVAPIVSPVVNLVTATGNDQSKIENIKSGSTLNTTKDASSSSLQSADSGEASSSKLGVTGIIGGVGSTVYGVGSTAIGLASSVAETAVSTIAAPIVSPVVNLVTASGNDQTKIENTKSDSTLDGAKDAGSPGLESTDKKGPASSRWGITRLFNSIGSTAIGLVS